MQELKRQRVEEGRLVDKRVAERERTGRDGSAEARGGGGDEGGSAGFIEKMRGEHVKSMGLEERMKRNRHYQQRGADVHNFMSRS